MPSGALGGGSSSTGRGLGSLTKGKVVVIGEYSVGKTSLVQRYISRGRVHRPEPTIGASFQVAVVGNVSYHPIQQLVAQAPTLASSSAVPGSTRQTSSSSGLASHGNAGGSSSSTPAVRPIRVGSEQDGGVLEISGSPQPVTLEVWDTAGSERYRALMPLYFRDANVALVCFDLGSAASFDRVNSWLSELRKHSAMGGGEDEDDDGNYSAGAGNLGIVKILCGTKADLRGSSREVSSDEAVALAAIEGMIYIETSAKAGTNVPALFQLVAEAVYSLKVSALQRTLRQEAGGGAPDNGSHNGKPRSLSRKVDFAAGRGDNTTPKRPCAC